MAASEVICELVWLLYLAVLHAYIIAIKSNTFFWNVQPTKSIYWTHARQVLEKVLRVKKEKYKASAILWWSHPHSSLTLSRPLLQLFLTPFHEGSLLPGFIIYQSQLLILNSNITPVILTCSSAGSNLISEERQVFTRISWKFLQHSLHQLTCGFIHSQHSSLELGPMLLCYLSSHPHFQQLENQRSRRSSSFPDAPALFTPPKALKYSAHRHPGPYYITSKVLA